MIESNVRYECADKNSALFIGTFVDVDDVTDELQSLIGSHVFTFDVAME